MSDGESGPTAGGPAEPGRTAPGAAIAPPSRRPIRLLTPEELPAHLGKQRFLAGIDAHTLPERALVLLWGASGSFKSFYALDLACRLGQRHTVVLVCAEGQSGLTLRLQAWSRFHGRPPGRLWIWPAGIDLSDAVIVASHAHDWQRLGPVLIVIDTLAHCLGGQDENKSADMMRVVRGAQTLIEVTGGTVVLLHHGTKTGLTERGSSALRAACDVIMHTDADDQTMILTCQKMKDGAEVWPPRAYRLRKVELPDAVEPDDPPGPLPTSCVLLPSSAAVRPPRGAEDLTPGQAALLDMLAAPLWSSGATPTDMADTLNRTRAAINRAASALVAARWIEANKSNGRWTIADAGRHALVAWRATQVTPLPPPLPPLRASPMPPAIADDAPAGHLVYLRDYLNQMHLEKEAARAASTQLFGIEDSAALSADQVDRLVSHLHDTVVAP